METTKTLINEETRSKANLFCDDIETYTIAQVNRLMQQAAFKDSYIALMPDAHPGYLAPIGFTATVPLSNPILPNIISSDAGCGITMYQVKIKKDWDKLDKVIRDHVPSDKHKNFDVFNTDQYDLLGLYASLNCRKYIPADKFLKAIGTLGYGNHFIELGKSLNYDAYYLTVHSGSRTIGKLVTDYYTEIAYKNNNTKHMELAALYDPDTIAEYLDDISVLVKYAIINRRVILNTICKEMDWKPLGNEINVVHNYYKRALDKLVIRKGAIAATKYSSIAIPINARDGIILGKTISDSINSKWNYSMPHGAGRTVNRNGASSMITMAQYKKDMQGIHSPSVCKKTLSESPAVYRDINKIIKAIEDNVQITDIVKPLYNYKTIGEGK